MVNPMMRIVLPMCVLAALTVVSAADQNKPAAPDGAKKTTQATPAKPAVSKTAPAGAGGVVVFKDPVTGQIRQPDASEIGGLLQQGPGAAAATAGEAVQELKGPGGAVGMTLPESSMVFMVATKEPDGRLVTDCVTGAKAAAARVAVGQTAKKLEKKENLDVK